MAVPLSTAHRRSSALILSHLPECGGAALHFVLTLADAVMQQCMPVEIAETPFYLKVTACMPARHIRFSARRPPTIMNLM